MRDLNQPYDDQTTFRLWSWLRQAIQEIAKEHHRDESDVARFLLARGLVAYEQDGQLIEPKGSRKKARK